jgi:hypothetical protein
MKPKFEPSHYFHMAKQIREIAEAILEHDTRSMVSQIAEDYERMGQEAMRALGEVTNGVAEEVGKRTLG